MLYSSNIHSTTYYAHQTSTTHCAVLPKHPLNDGPCSLNIHCTKYRAHKNIHSMMYYAHQTATPQWAVLTKHPLHNVLGCAVLTKHPLHDVLCSPNLHLKMCCAHQTSPHNVLFSRNIHSTMCFAHQTPTPRCAVVCSPNIQSALCFGNQTYNSTTQLP